MDQEQAKRIFEKCDKVRNWSTFRGTVYRIFLKHIYRHSLQDIPQAHLEAQFTGYSSSTFRGTGTVYRISLKPFHKLDLHTQDYMRTWP
jgi:hypothetical protein